MKKSILFSYLLCLLIWGCTEDIPLTFRNENFSEKNLESCRDLSCPEISLSYVVAEKEDERSATINTVIDSLIADVLYLGDETEAPAASDVKEAVQNFISMFRTHSAEFPDMQVEYFAEVDIAVSRLSSEFISLEMNYYLFTGGAHGYGGTRYVNLDGESGEEYELTEVIGDLQGLEKHCEEVFRKKYGIPYGSGINSKGFWFENAQFHLPETIGFSRDSLLLTYNPYEVASYATGPVSVNIPLNEITAFLNISLE